MDKYGIKRIENYIQAVITKLTMCTNVTQSKPSKQHYLEIFCIMVNAENSP